MGFLSMVGCEGVWTGGEGMGNMHLLGMPFRCKGASGKRGYQFQKFNIKCKNM